jgi:hypothetical protein
VVVSAARVRAAGRPGGEDRGATTCSGDPFGPRRARGSPAERQAPAGRHLLPPRLGFELSSSGRGGLHLAIGLAGARPAQPAPVELRSASATTSDPARLHGAVACYAPCRDLSGRRPTTVVPSPFVRGSLPQVGDGRGSRFRVDGRTRDGRCLFTPSVAVVPGVRLPQVGDGRGSTPPESLLTVNRARSNTKRDDDGRGEGQGDRGDPRRRAGGARRCGWSTARPRRTRTGASWTRLPRAGRRGPGGRARGAVPGTRASGRGAGLPGVLREVPRDAAAGASPAGVGRHARPGAAEHAPGDPVPDGPAGPAAAQLRAVPREDAGVERAVRAVAHDERPERANRCGQRRPSSWPRRSSGRSSST